MYKKRKTTYAKKIAYYDAKKNIYESKREIVDHLVKEGKISEENSEQEWAKMVAEEMSRLGFSVPKKILKIYEVEKY